MKNKELPNSQSICTAKMPYDTLIFCKCAQVDAIDNETAVEHETMSCAPIRNVLGLFMLHYCNNYLPVPWRECTYDGNEGASTVKIGQRIGKQLTSLSDRR